MQKPGEAEIARTAYLIWEQEGRPHGRDQAHWFQAERRLTERKQPSLSRPAASAAKPRAGQRKRG